MTVSILHLLNVMLMFGMYETPSSIQKLLKVILNLLHGTQDITTEEELLYINKRNEL